MIELTIKVPDQLGKQLQRMHDRLPEILELGLRELQAEQSDRFKDLNAIMDLIASQPAPEQIMAIHPSPELQERVSELLYNSKQGEISSEEQIELERYLMLEHLVRLAKIHAAEQLAFAVL